MKAVSRQQALGPTPATPTSGIWSRLALPRGAAKGIMRIGEMTVENGERWWHRFHYEDWVAREGLELIRGHSVQDVYTVPLRHWARTDGYAVQIELDGASEQATAYVQEIPPAGKLNPMRHVYEEMVFVLSGRGSTSVWYDEGQKRSFEWGPWSLFAIPLNAWYQHFNLSGSEPARYVALTTAPTMMNFIRDDNFIFN